MSRSKQKSHPNPKFHANLTFSALQKATRRCPWTTSEKQTSTRRRMKQMDTEHHVGLRAPQRGARRGGIHPSLVSHSPSSWACRAEKCGFHQNTNPTFPVFLLVCLQDVTGRPHSPSPSASAAHTGRRMQPSLAF